MEQPTPATLTGWGQMLSCWIGGVIEGLSSLSAGREGMGAGQWVARTKALD